MDVVFKTEVGIFNHRVAGILIENHHVLLHRNVNDNFWALPGGRVTMNEDSKMSIKREFNEELGIDVQVERLLWVVENFFEYNGGNFHELGFYYLVTLDESMSFFNNDPFHGMEGEHLIFKWFPIEELENLAIYPAFLRSDLLDIPSYTEHIIERND